MRKKAIEMKVRVEGIEPPRLAALDPKSNASTSSAIPASCRFMTAFCHKNGKDINFSEISYTVNNYFIFRELFYG